ncbi:MAG: hypothetical protein KDD94_06160 [Calditrichaeota bacterium]|nr:hypothetical protein [Calditrichota bacterium]
MGLFDKIFKGKKSDEVLDSFPQLKPVDRRSETRETSEGKVIFNEFRIHGKTYYFKYTNRKGEVSDRIILLVTVTTYSDGRIKISGYDNDRKEIRRFNLDYAHEFQNEDLEPIKEHKEYFLKLVEDVQPEKTGEVEPK